MKAVRTVLLALVTMGAALAATGCLHPEDLNALEPEATTDPPAARVVVEDVDVDSDGPEEEAAPSAAALPGAPLPASNADHPPPDPVPFRLGAGRGMLGRVDLGPCRERGLPQGYLRMRVTFRHSGRVVHATVESEAAPPHEALECIAEQLEVAMVPVFDGGDVTLSKSLFVN
jgi:hypothetical protein